MHLNDIPIAAALRKMHTAAPFSYTRPQRRLSYLVRCGEQITPEFTDSPLKPPLLLTIERRTHYYSAECEEGEKKTSDVVWEIFKRAHYRLIIRCCTSELKNKCFMISAAHSSALKTPFVFFFYFLFYLVSVIPHASWGAEMHSNLIKPSKLWSNRRLLSAKACLKGHLMSPLYRIQTLSRTTV